MFTFALAWGWTSEAEASVRGRKAVPDLRNPKPGRRSAATGKVKIPVTLHFATARGEMLTSPWRVRRWIARANEALAPAGIEVDVIAMRKLPAGNRSITRRRDRHRLAAYAPNDGTVHIFVAEDLDLGVMSRLGRRVRGLHWRYYGPKRDIRRREYVVVTREAPDTTLAHEIGHLLGLRHSVAPDNIMCSCRTSPSSFTQVQTQQLRSAAHAWVAGERGASLRLADRRRRR